MCANGYMDLNGGEGSTATCRIAYDWRQGHVYRNGFARTAAQQWTATITDESHDAWHAGHDARDVCGSRQLARPPVLGQRLLGTVRRAT